MGTSFYISPRKAIMKAVFALAFCVVAALAAPSVLRINKDAVLREAELPLQYTSVRRDAFLRKVNNERNTWTAGINSRFENATKEFILGQMGVLSEKSPITLPTLEEDVMLGLPSDFDSRKEWGSMCPSTSEIRDQASCGSCWAFGAVEAMTDRICIASKGASKPHISAEDLLSCCHMCGMGCNGGYPEAAWSYYKNEGIVTGGQYGTKEGCQPYALPHCDHHVTGKYSPCGSIQPTPRCQSTCESGYSKSCSADKHKGMSAHAVPASLIQQEIMNNGPVEGTFTVYEDFLHYRSGVYSHTSGQALGGHAIKILGWGVDNGTPYWIVANSWNTDWGNQGFFNIKRGNDECGIESGVVAGKPGQ